MKTCKIYLNLADFRMQKNEQLIRVYSKINEKCKIKFFYLKLRFQTQFE